MSTITPRTRRALREALVGEYLAVIQELFEDEGLVSGPAPGPNVSGQRRRSVESYYAAVDWHSAEDTARMLRVFEAELQRLRDAGRAPEADSIESLLRLDGFARDEAGRLATPEPLSLPEETLASLTDASSIRLHLERVSLSMEKDPESAIGSAKELVESTAKLVLETIGQDWSDADDLPDLARKAQKALALHPETVAPDREGYPTIKRVLGGLVTVVCGLAELRNLYGTGHGQVRRHSGISPRHAHLAVGAATVYCRLMLETLEEPKAPWRQAHETPDTSERAETREARLSSLRPSTL